MQGLPGAREGDLGSTRPSFRPKHRHSSHPRCRLCRRSAPHLLHSSQSQNHRPRQQCFRRPSRLRCESPLPQILAPRFPHPPRWRYNQPLSTDVVPSWIVRPRFLSRLQVEQKAALKRKRPYINGVCTCEKDGVPSASTETAHSMFCQLYRCYAYEAGGCDGRVDPPKSKDDPTIMTGWECECIQFAFDPDYDIGGENADLLISRSRRHVRSHVDEYGLIDRPGGRALRCNCECNYVGGPYVPMCPFRPHGVTGLARGDMYKRLRAAWDGRGGWEWEEPPEDLSPWYSKRGVNV